MTGGEFPMIDISAEHIRAMVEEYRDEAVRLFQETVQIPSPTGQEGRLSAFFAEYMESFGLEVRKYEYEQGRPNLLAEWFGPEKGPRFVFNGHMDVFPPVESDPGMYGPWSGKVTDG